MDIKVKCIEHNVTQTRLSETIETTKSYGNRVIHKQDGLVSNPYVKMVITPEYGKEPIFVMR